jgi:hypothetical protein
MQNKQPSRLEKALKLDYHSEKDDIWLTSQNTLRKLIGILGMGLPLLLFLVLLIDAHYATPLYSISHYYFTRACGVFLIIVSLLGIFLLIYKGKDPVDFYISTAAGLFALCLLIFPTYNISNNCNDKDYLYSLTILHNSDFRPGLHLVSAAIFLSCLAFMSLFLFTRSDKSPKDRGRPKRIRNRIYRTCGVIMIIALLVIVANFAFHVFPGNFFSDHHLMFWMETLAVESFGVSWLVKAEVILKD